MKHEVFINIQLRYINLMYFYEQCILFIFLEYVNT
jgi:hypothetical protein